MDLSNPTGSDVTFTYSTSNGAGLADSDYVEVENASSSIPAGSAVGHADVHVIGHLNREANEVLFAVLESATNVNLGSLVRELTIQNDDRFTLPLP